MVREACLASVTTPILYPIGVAIDVFSNQDSGAVACSATKKVEAEACSETNKWVKAYSAINKGGAEARSANNMGG